MRQLELAKWPISKFLEQYQSKNTIKAYKSGLTKYFELIYPHLIKIKKDAYKFRYKNLEHYRGQMEKYEAELDRASLEYVSQIKDPREDLLLYSKHISNMAPITQGVYLSAVYRYFEDNGIDLPARFKKNIKGKNTDPISEEFVPRAEDIKNLVSHLDLGEVTFVLVLSSSGMRDGEALKLTVDNLDLDHDPPKINLPASITKTKQKRIVFISHEAKDHLERWLAYRLEYANRAAERKAGFTYDPNDKRVFTFSYQNLRDKWGIAAEKAGYGKRDDKTGRLAFRIHNLRKFFRTHGRWTNPDIAEALMGHQAGLKAIYARFDQAEEILREGYLQAEPNLSIFSSSKTSLELKEKVNQHEEEYQKLNRLMTLKTNNLDEFESYEAYAKFFDDEELQKKFINLCRLVNNAQVKLLRGSISVPP